MTHGPEIREFPESPQQMPVVPGAWSEPVTIGTEGVDEPALTENDPYGDTRFDPVGIGTGDVPESEHHSEHPVPDWELTDATDDGHAPDAPGADGGGPPTDLPPLVTTGEGEPHRGEALKEMVSYVDGINPEIELRAYHKVLEHFDDDIQLFMIDHDLDNRESAVDTLANQKIDGSDNSIRGEALYEEMEDAEILYGGKLAAAGLELVTLGDDIRLAMADPGYFTEAVEQMPAPVDADEQEAFNLQALYIVDVATEDACTAIIADNPDDSQAAVGWSPPPSHTFTRGAEQAMAQPEARGFAAALAEQATTLATHLQTQGAPASVVDPVRQLGIAQSEGLTVEWAVGRALDVLGRSHTPVGIDRLRTPNDWEHVVDYVIHLATNAADSRFIAEVRQTLDTDIQATLAGSPSDAPIDLQQRYEQAVPMLRQAQRRIDAFFNR